MILKKNSKDKTVDVVIFGGNDTNGATPGNYKESIKLIRDVAFAKLGFYPDVAIGPKVTSGADDMVYYDNKNRRLYIGRESIKKIPITPGYNSEDLDSAEKNNWQ